MKNLKTFLFGLVLVLVGVIVILNTLNVVTIHLFFKGWWTLFIIIPSLYNVVYKRKYATGLFFLAIGVLLLLAEQDIISYSVFGQLIFPVLLVVFGIKILFNRNKKSNFRFFDNINITSNNTDPNTTYTNTDINFNFNNQEITEDLEYNFVKTNAVIDLSEAIIKRNFSIEINNVFTSLVIILPKNCKLNIEKNVVGGSFINKFKPTSLEYKVNLEINNVFSKITVA